MFFPKDEENEKLISLNKPPVYNENKKIILNRGIKENEYDEVCSFLSRENKTVSGNITLLPKNELEKMLSFETFSVLMRSVNKNILIGTIFSIIFPIKCIFEEEKEEIIKHGCTSFFKCNFNSKKTWFMYGINKRIIFLWL